MTTIRIIDLETTGAEATDHVIELGYCDYDAETKAISDPVSELFFVDDISPESRAVHHIRLADIPAHAQRFDAFANVLMPADTNAVRFFAAHNASFEAQFIDFEDRHLICTYKAALRAWPEASSHSNGALRYWLEDQGKIAPDHFRTLPAHRAGPDAYVTAHLLKALFEAGVTGREMVAWSKEPALLPRCTIGKFRNSPWSGVDGGFLEWMLRQPDMSVDLKWNAERELRRRAGG